MDKGLKTALIIGGVIIGVIIIVSVVTGIFGGWQDYRWGMMGPGTAGGTGFMFLMPLLGIVVIGLIIWAVVAATRSAGGSSQAAESPLEILKKRYARGEITKQEYEDRKKDLV